MGAALVYGGGFLLLVWVAGGLAAALAWVAVGGWIGVALWLLTAAGLLKWGKLMDILDRLTDKRKLAELVERKPQSAARVIDAAAVAATLTAKVFGQGPVIADVSTQIKTRFAKSRRTKPVGVFMFAGPPATGKTWFAKVLAEALYGDPKALVLVEGGQYTQPHLASGLFGQSKGYAGSDSYGLLTGALRAKPDRVIVLDEIEKMHPDLHVKFLSAWNDGFITEMSTGEKVSTTDAVFILTTNAAQRDIAELAVQFGDDFDGLSDACKSALKDSFRPEVLSRIDRVFAFLPLQGLDVARVVARQIEDGVREFDVEIEQIEAEVLFATVDEAARRRADPREIARILEKAIDPQIVALKERGVQRVRLLEADDGGVRVVAA